MTKNDLVSTTARPCYSPGTQSKTEGASDSVNRSHSANVVREQVTECLTRRQAAEYIRDILGRPISFSTANKLAALGEFAHPALWWGRRPLYTRVDLRQWVEARSRPTKGGSQNKADSVAALSTAATNEASTTAAITDT
jgi:hypothetical protein